MVDSFCKARKAIGKDAVKGAAAPGEGPQYALDVCHQLLERLQGQGDERDIVRVGDVFALLVDHYMSMSDPGSGGAKEALRLVGDMEARGIYLDPFLDKATLNRIYAANGIDPDDEGKSPGRKSSRGGGGAGGSDNGMESSMEGGELDESLEEELDEELEWGD